MAQEPPRYLSTTPTAGTPLDDYLSTDPQAGSTAPAASGGLGGFLSEATKSLNPVNINAALQAAFWHPIDTAKGVLAAQDVPRQEAQTAFKQGDYLTATRKMVDWLIPILGPRLDEAADYMQHGEIARGLGATADVGLNIAGPKIAAKIASVPVLPRVGTGVPAAVSDAVQFGLREGIPVDVATATGNRFVRGVQRLSEESAGGSFVAEQARAAQADALTATGERLAARTSPAPVTAEQAGQAVRDAVTKRAAAYDAAADVGYGRLRAIETKVGMPVDVSATKAAMQPIYDALKREAALVPLMGDKARALTTLDRLMQAPDLAPLSTADAALGDLKSLARVDQTFRRTAGQGVAAEAVTNLDKAVRAAAQAAGPDAMQALMDGRAATVNKFKTIDLLDRLRTEPVGVFNQATWAKDAGIGQLRDLARVAPTELRQVGRAWLENALTKATAEGGFSRAQGILAEWQNLGPETKQLLFRDPAHIKDLDNFFLLAKKLAENPNPSGTALTLAKGGELGALFTTPAVGIPYTLSAPVVAKLLLSPTTTRLLLQGLRLPVSATAARTAWVGQLGRLLAAPPAPALSPNPVADTSPAAPQP